MTIKIQKNKLTYLDQQLNSMIFTPSPDTKLAQALAIFTHGYTSHKASILSWATRLTEEGIPTIIFDQPGHYLGTFSEVSDFELYKANAPGLFKKAFIDLETVINEEFPLTPININSDEYRVILGGHSLGALLSLTALESNDFQEHNAISLCVGLGMPPEGVTHIFDTPFYKSTLNTRRQLVSPAISPEVVFPWIKKRKEELVLTGKRIHFITGADDVVVGKNGTQIMVDSLSSNNNVSYDSPSKLPHHMPELAAPHIRKFLKDEGII